MIKVKAVRGLVGLAFLAVTAAAAPSFAKPPNAAVTGSGTGCLVADANGAYHGDANCNWHIVTRSDANGNQALLSYQDQGTLPEGAPRPTSARRNPVSYAIYGIPCEGTEVTTPSGEYRSDCRFNANQ